MSSPPPSPKKTALDYYVEAIQGLDSGNADLLPTGKKKGGGKKSKVIKVKAPMLDGGIDPVDDDLDLEEVEMSENAASGGGGDGDSENAAEGEEEFGDEDDEEEDDDDVSALTVVDELNNRLRENDEDLVRLDVSCTYLSQYSDWMKKDFFEALRVNTTVTTVHLSGNNLQDCLTSEEFKEMMTAIGSLANLNELFVFQGKCRLFTEELLCQCLKAAKNLKVLMIWDFEKMHTKMILAGAIRQCPALERLTLTLTNDLPYACMDVYVMGLAQHPKLRVLSMRCAGGRQQEPVISPEAMNLLLNSQSIESLYMENLGLADDHCDVISEELKTNKVLTLLDLKDNLFTDDCLYSFAGGLRVNKTLTSLDVSGALISEGGVKRLTEALSENSTLTNLELEGTTERYKDEFHVPEGHSNTEYMQALDFQLRLNRAGTGQANRKVFVESLNSVSDHLGIIYYFVRAHPEHCERPTGILTPPPKKLYKIAMPKKEPPTEEKTMEE